VAFLVSAAMQPCFIGRLIRLYASYSSAMPAFITRRRAEFFIAMQPFNGAFGEVLDDQIYNGF